MLVVTRATAGFDVMITAGRDTTAPPPPPPPLAVVGGAAFAAVGGAAPLPLPVFAAVKFGGAARSHRLLRPLALVWTEIAAAAASASARGSEAAFEVFAVAVFGADAAVSNGLFGVGSKTPATANSIEL